MGDLNAKVGKEQDPLSVTVDPHGLGKRNERGDLWTEWCSTHDYVILNIPGFSIIRDIYTHGRVQEMVPEIRLTT